MSSSSSSKNDQGKDGIKFDQESFLSYPSSSSSSSDKQTSTTNALSNVRLFIANLNGSVTEHDLLIAFKPFGNLRKLDLIFHKNGPLKGQPKGFAFVEFADPNQASKAKSSLDGKPLRGKEMHIGFAKLNVAIESQRVGPQRKHNNDKLSNEPQKSTMLSLNKNLNRKDTTNSRIAALEAKLESMRNRNKNESNMSSSSDIYQSRRPKSLPERPKHLPLKPSDKLTKH